MNTSLVNSVVEDLRSYASSDSSGLLNNSAYTQYIGKDISTLEGYIDQYSIRATPDITSLLQSFNSYLPKNYNASISVSVSSNISLRVKRLVSTLDTIYFDTNFLARKLDCSTEEVESALKADSTYRKSLISDRKRGNIYMINKKNAVISDFWNFLRDFSSH